MCCTTRHAVLSETIKAEAALSSAGVPSQAMLQHRLEAPALALKPEARWAVQVKNTFLDVVVSPQASLRRCASAPRSRLCGHGGETGTTKVFSSSPCAEVGSSHVLATTSFAESSAKLVVPCRDDPAAELADAEARAKLTDVDQELSAVVPEHAAPTREAKEIAKVVDGRAELARDPMERGMRRAVFAKDADEIAKVARESAELVGVSAEFERDSQVECPASNDPSQSRGAGAVTARVRPLSIAGRRRRNGTRDERLLSRDEVEAMVLSLPSLGSGPKKNAIRRLNVQASVLAATGEDHLIEFAN